MKNMFFGIGLLSAFQAPAEQIYRFTASAAAYEANAYLLESKEGWVLVDALMLRDDLASIVATIKNSKKPLKGVLITHPHVDHFAGIAWLQAEFPKLSVYMTKASEKAMYEVHKDALTSGWINVFGDQYPKTLTPNVVVINDGQSLNVDGLLFNVHALGAGEAAEHVAYERADTRQLFTGDALVSSYVVYVGEGRSKALLALYDKMVTLVSDDYRVYPGHGGVQPLAQVVADNRKQVMMMRNIAMQYLQQNPEQLKNKHFTADDIRHVGALISTQFGGYSGYGMPTQALITGYNVRGLLAEVANELNENK
ncbi:MBL fold metallo-hydrolase [Pseudoalteromonas xiamenensis]|uniref:MBL fold metallo-hydrolase n=1 Tax=Pseudoalteromonas xiamenensis TaxID=882626 RepID=UPI0027E4068A|nr:MBL fold metallo-hydrolase [Pseudoalteromonas xiamenensis]WMN61374.1 MBL fold metallo-hydrolase [Pseudoalteromonas xiamenensis]